MLQTVKVVFLNSRTASMVKRELIIYPSPGPNAHSSGGICASKSCWFNWFLQFHSLSKVLPETDESVSVAPHFLMRAAAVTLHSNKTSWTRFRWFPLSEEPSQKLR